MSAAVMPAPSRTQGMPRDGPATLVASTSLPRAPGSCASQLPMMVSVAPIGFLARRHRVHLGGVDEVDAALDRAVEDGVGVGFVDLLAEGHGAQADGGDAQVARAERDEVHG